jgi:hypothetical protein
VKCRFPSFEVYLQAEYVVIDSNDSLWSECVNVQPEDEDSIGCLSDNFKVLLTSLNMIILYQEDIAHRSIINAEDGDTVGKQSLNTRQIDRRKN